MNTMAIENTPDKTYHDSEHLENELIHTAQDIQIEELKIAQKSEGLLDSILHPHHNHDNTKNQSCDPAEIFNPQMLEDLTEIVLKAKTTGKKIRCAASGHLWSSTSVTDGYLVIVNKMEKVYTPVYSIHPSVLLLVDEV
ncbi:hypothetical protein BGW39_008071 [Mortierella sp. 14UC]|nr:hypothetical protein BGW39_008071 [Mortierella sp. 14UC]